MFLPQPVALLRAKPTVQQNYGPGSQQVRVRGLLRLFAALFGPYAKERRFVDFENRNPNATRRLQEVVLLFPGENPVPPVLSRLHSDLHRYTLDLSPFRRQHQDAP